MHLYCKTESLFLIVKNPLFCISRIFASIYLWQTRCNNRGSTVLKIWKSILNFPPKTFSNIKGVCPHYLPSNCYISIKIVLPSLNLFLECQMWILSVNEWKMRMLSAKLGCTGQVFSGKTESKTEVTRQLGETVFFWCWDQLLGWKFVRPQ